jgi:hypothetical protein
VRLGTATHAVLAILCVPRDLPWLTMGDIILLGENRGRVLSLNEVASALANLEPAGHVAVRRDRRPYRYQGCP